MSNAIRNEVGIVFVPVGSMLTLVFRDPAGNLSMARERKRRAAERERGRARPGPAGRRPDPGAKLSR